MRKSYKWLFTIPLFALTSCGYGLEELYDGDAYNSPIFEKNYYREWDDELVNKITNKDAQDIELDYEKNNVFLSYYGDEHFHKLEPSRAESNDPVDGHPEYLTYDGIDKSVPYYYGPKKCLSNIDDSFRYGYMSKLFDGQMFCGGKFQLSRVQIDERGFGKLFEKECISAKYFAMNFKASSDYTQKETNPATNNHRSEINLKIGFYLENDKGFEKKVYTYKFQDIPENSKTRSVPTNTGDDREPGSCSYIFFGFELGETININRCRGISVSYDLIKDPDKENKGLDYALMLYEILLPDSTWH